MKTTVLQSQHAYPRFSSLLPAFDIRSGAYCARFARNEADLRNAQTLRYEVFNLELAEGFDRSHAEGRDIDQYDAGCHHLLVIEQATGSVIGTYRMQIAEMAAAHCGFYSKDEFDLSNLPDAFLNNAVELGRACVARDHRSGRVLYLLWRGLIHYLVQNRRRYFFGCSLITSQDPVDAARVLAYLRANGHLHPTLHVSPKPDFDVMPAAAAEHLADDAMIPRLMRLYLTYSSKICGTPAIDRQFKTIDFFTVFDQCAVSKKTQKLLFT